MTHSVINGNTTIAATDCYGAVYDDGKIEMGIGNEFKEYIDKRILFSLRLNMMSIPDQIEKVMEDEENFDMIIDPAEAVVKAHELKYKL